MLIIVKSATKRYVSAVHIVLAHLFIIDLQTQGLSFPLIFDSKLIKKLAQPCSYAVHV